MRDVLAILAAGVVACLTFFINLFFVVRWIEPMGPLEHVNVSAIVAIILWSFTVPIVAAVFTIRLIGTKAHNGSDRDAADSDEKMS